MRPLLFANPQIGAAYQNDPRSAYAQGLMQQGASTAPVHSWGEAVARALQAPLGGYFASQNRHDYQAQDDKYRQGLAKALAGDDIGASLSGSDDPSLQMLGLNYQLDTGKLKQTAKYQRQNELATKGLMENADGSVSPIPRFGTAMGGIKNEETIAAIPGEVQKQQAMIPGEVQKQQALIPGAVSEATQKAQATAPIDIAKAQTVFNTTEGPQKQRDFGEKLADDYHQDKNVQAYQIVVPVYKSMVDAAGRNTRAADLNMVYGMAKIFDPGSVVREGEQVLVNNTQGIPDQILGIINRWNAKEGLQPEARRALLAEAKSRVDQAGALYNQTKDFYSKRASDAGLDPNGVLFDIGGTPDAPGSAGGPQGPKGAPKVLIYNPATKQMEPAP